MELRSSLPHTYPEKNQHVRNDSVNTIATANYVRQYEKKNTFGPPLCMFSVQPSEVNVEVGWLNQFPR